MGLAMARAENAGEEVHPAAERRGRPTADDRMLTFHSRLRERGLKSTGQRDDIARVFFELRLSNGFRG